MKVVLLDIQSDRENRLKREFQGGYGLRLHLGDSLPARFLHRISRSESSCMPVIHLAYLAAIAQRHGHDVAYAVNEVPSDADLVVIHASLVAHGEEMARARALASEGRHVAFVGPLASGTSESFVEKNIASVVGEPEAAFLDLMERGRFPEGRVESPPVTNLDRLPFPSWDPFPYWTFSLAPKLSVAPVFPMLASRACPYKCDYCPYLVMTPTYRRRGLESVVAELEYLKNRYGMRGVFFRDPTFTADRKRTLALSRAMLDRRLGIEFQCETRLDCLDEELLDSLAAAGLRGLNVGVENPDASILEKNRRRPIAIEHQERIIRHAERRGVKVNCFYILAYPQDSRSSVESTLRYARHLNTFNATFFVYTPLPGTGSFVRVRDRIATPWEKFDGFTLNYQHERLDAAEVARLVEKAYLTYYFRPAYIAKFLYQRFGQR